VPAGLVDTAKAVCGEIRVDNTLFNQIKNKTSIFRCESD
jgi:hypothetical protein